LKADSITKTGNERRSSDVDALKLNAAQIRQLYAQVPLGVFFAAALTVLVLTAVLWNVTPRWLLIVWCVASLAMYLARQRLVAAFSAASPSDEATIRWGAWYAIEVSAGGVLWGVAAIFLFPAESVLHQAILAFLLAGICAGNTAGTCPRKEVYLPFLIIVVLSLAGRYFYEGDLAHVTMGAMAIVLLGCFILIGNRMHAANTESLKLRFQNQDLIGELTEKEARTQALNRDLQSEIAERMHAEQALRQSEERYRQLVENANDFIYSTDAEGRFTFVNPIALKITGYSEEEILGRGYHDLVPEDYRERIEEFYRFQFGDKISETYLEFPILTKKGVLVWTGQNVQLITEDDRIQGFQGICRDITERKHAEDALRNAHDTLERRVEERTADLSQVNEQLRKEIAERERAEKLLEEAHFQLEERARECFVSEERFRAVFEAAEDCMFIKDKDLSYTHVNPAMLRLLEMDRSLVVGESDNGVFGPDYGAQTAYLERRVLAGQTVETEHTLIWRDWPTALNVIRFPMRDRADVIVGICGIARDVSDRSQREKNSIGESPSYVSSTFRAALGQVESAAETDSVALFLGETGSGKDWLARCLHDRSGRSNGPFFSINSAALNPDLIESELFGHEAGAFTGARGRKRGLLELAEGGTLLLNEIGEMPLPLQAKLLAFLDTGSFTRVGGETGVSPNVRIVAATNRDIKKEMDRGSFRKDLFYRLNVFTVTVPPLRDRIDDVPILARALLRSLTEKMGISEIPSLNNEALQAMTQYPWPGNVRELRNLLERALILCDGNTITAADLTLTREESESAGAHARTSRDTDPSLRQSLPDALETTKRIMITEALRDSGGSIKDAASALGVTRGSLKHHMRSLGIRR